MSDTYFLAKVGTLVVLASLVWMPCHAAIGDVCINDENCTYIGGTCVAMNCSCSDTFYINGTQCIARVTHNQTCSSDVMCLYSLKCTSNICSCNDSTTQYFDSVGNTCKLRVTHNQTCSSDVMCLYSLKCTSYICSCNDTTTQYFDSGGNTCKPKKSLGEICTSGIQCLEANSECVNKCQCQLNYFDTNNGDNGGSCQPLANLAVTSIQLKYRSETYLVITWTAPALVSTVEEYRYQVSDNPTEISVSKLLEANVTGLQPGKLYTIYVISVDSNSRPDIQKTSVQTMLATNPAVPGPIDIGNSDLSASDGSITVRWMSTGFVDNYNVSCDDSTITIGNRYPAIPQVTISGARNGKRYQLTYYAISNSLISSSYSEIFRTQVTSPNPPTISPCSEDDIFSTHLILKWQEPSNPNGDILYYLIETISPTPGQINTSTSVLQQDVQSLLEEQQYCFTMKTVNDGPFNISDIASSGQICCSTKAGSATIPRNVTFSKITSRSFQITWSKPEDSRGNIVSYRLRLKVSSACEVEIIFQCTDCGATSNTAYMECLGKRRDIVNINTTQANTMVTYTVGNLSPFVEYEVWIAAINSHGDGDRNISMVKTDSEVPQKPENVTAVVISATEISVNWNQPGPTPGITTYFVEGFEIVEGVAYSVKFMNTTGFSVQTVKFTALEEYWNYTFSVKASTDKGNSSSSGLSNVVTTLQAAPGPVENFQVTRPSGTYRQMNVSWQTPSLRNRNGVLVKYILKHNSTGAVPEQTVLASDPPLMVTLNVVPERYYHLEVYAVNTNGDKGPENKADYYAIPGPPMPPLIPAVSNDTTLPLGTQNTIKLKFNLDWFLNTDNGIRTDGGVMICPESNCDIYGNSNNKLANYFSDKIATWKQSKLSGFTKAYRVTNRTWIDKVATSGRRKRSTNEVTLVIGEDTQCDKINDTTYCNGPLPPGTSFIVVTFVCTNGGCTESPHYGPFATLVVPVENFPIAIVAGAVGGGVALIIVIMIIVLVKRRGHGHKQMDDADADFECPTPLETPSVERKNIKRKRPVMMSMFDEHVEKLHKDSNLKFAHEYEEVKVLTDPKTLKDASTAMAETEQNKLKNRYVNILPYDKTIVKLLPLEDDDENGSTFINANYIPGYSSKREYIASQGPIPSTIDDFWRMIWEQNVSIIVMLTLCKEEGRIKCECYWPTESSEPKQYGDIGVEMGSCSTINTYEMRVFKLTLGNKTRNVKHFHFLNWKDFSANVQNDVMIDFIQNVRSHVTIPESKVPMVVHCSAGVGRTGTFIALDHLMQFIRDHDFSHTIDIFDLVVTMRECRMYMVQTEQQYIFIHDCIKDILERKRQKELANQDGGDDLYGNSNLQENIYENKAFEAEPELYQNFNLNQSPKTDL